MVNLLRLVREFVEDETRRADFRADPSLLITETGGDLSGEDVEAALEVVRTQVAPAIAGRLAPDGHDLRFPRLTPGDNETPLTVGLRCMRWIDRRLGATADDADTEFEAALFGLTGYEPPTLPSPTPVEPPDATAPPTEDATAPPTEEDDDGETAPAIPLLDIDVEADIDESADDTESFDIDELVDDDDTESIDAETSDDRGAWAMGPDGPDHSPPPGDPAADDDSEPVESAEPDEDEPVEPVGADENEPVEPVEAGIPVAPVAPDAPPPAGTAASERGGRSLFGGGAAMKLPFVGDTEPIDLPFAGDQLDLPFAADEPEDVEDTDEDESDDLDDAVPDAATEDAVGDHDAEEPPADDGPGARLEPGLEPQFRTLEVVVLPLGLPEVGVPPGTQATVVAVHLEPTLHYEIEVDDEHGAPAFLGAVTPDSLAPLPR